MAFGVLFAQTKTMDHPPDLLVWLAALGLLITAFVATLKQKQNPQAPFFQAITGFQLLVCVFVILNIIQHLHSL